MGPSGWGAVAGTGHLVVRAALPASTPPILPSTKHPGAATWWSYARSRVRTVVDLVAVQTKDFRATRRTSNLPGVG